MREDQDIRNRGRLEEVLDPIGDREWSDDYWNALYRPLRQYLLRKIANAYRQLHRDEIADATDEVIWRLFKNFKFARLSEVAPDRRRIVFYGFVKQTVRSVIADAYRHKGFRPPKGKESQALPRKISPEIVARAFETLTQQEQEVLRLRIFQKLSYREIQTRCAVRSELPTISALKMRVSRATAALRDLIVKLAAEGGDDPPVIK